MNYFALMLLAIASHCGAGPPRIDSSLPVTGEAVSAAGDVTEGGDASTRLKVTSTSLVSSGINPTTTTLVKGSVSTTAIITATTSTTTAPPATTLTTAVTPTTTTSKPNFAAECEPGYYCPTPTERLICPAGYFCPRNSTEYLNRPCTAGNYCPVGSSVATGNGLCKAGYYCPAGSKDAEGAGQCRAGRYCKEGSTTVDGQGACRAGYYCPAGSSTPTEVGSGPGKCTAEGASQADDCGLGFYCGGAANDCATRSACTALPENAKGYTNKFATDLAECKFDCRSGYQQSESRCVADAIFYCGSASATYLKGQCWYLGGRGLSCDTTCNQLGKRYSEKTATLAGSANIAYACPSCQQVCQDLVAKLTATAPQTVYGAPLGVTAGIGCAYFDNGTSSYPILVGNPVTTGYGALNSAKRVCACD